MVGDHSIYPVESEGKPRMSKELNQLVGYIEENSDGYFLKGNLKDLEELLDQLFSSPETIDLVSQKKLFLLSMSCYPLFSYSLDRDLRKLPELLRYSLLSKCFYSFGGVATPNVVSEEVEALLDETDEDWYENQVVGHRIFKLREQVLRNPSLDLEILADEFENSGDVGNLSAILKNPNCPIEFLQSIIESEHFVFDEGENNELVEEAKEILSKR
jgi:hypothetical protein